MKPIPPIRWRMLRQYSVDGVVVASSTLPPGFAKAFRDAGVPVVHSFGRYASAPEVHVVGIDNAECGRMAARELVRRGYPTWPFSAARNRRPRPRTGFAGFMKSWRATRTFRCGTASRRPIPSRPAGRRCLRLLWTGPPARPISAATTCCRSGR
jgi:DNA-binding LacI/PurR family transcriptional regulator